MLWEKMLAFYSHLTFAKVQKKVELRKFFGTFFSYFFNFFYPRFGGIKNTPFLTRLRLVGSEITAHSWRDYGSLKCGAEKAESRKVGKWTLVGFEAGKWTLFSRSFYNLYYYHYIYILLLIILLPKNSLMSTFLLSYYPTFSGRIL